MPSAWITHVKQFAKDNNNSYKHALKKQVQVLKNLNNLEYFFKKVLV